MDKSLQAAVELHNAAVAQFRSGRADEAIENFSLALDMRLAAAGRALFEATRQQGELRLAGEAAARAALLEPMNFPFVQRALEFNVRYACDQNVPYQNVAPRGPAKWSIIVCSHDDMTYAKFQDNFNAVAGDHRLQFVRISDARSMNEGYRRGLDHALFTNIILCHHDIELLVPDFFDRLAEHLDYYDFVGVAGATRMSGPAILFDGHPHLVSRLSQPSDSIGSRVLTSRNPFAGVRDAAVLDGVFIACKRPALEQLGFDMKIEGFHYYDVDLGHRAFLAGYSLAVAPDLALHHQSLGDFNEDWRRAFEHFSRKFPELGGTPSPNGHHYSAPIACGDETSVWAWLNVLADKWDRPEGGGEKA
jgi:hypothetical protein